MPNWNWCCTDCLNTTKLSKYNEMKSERRSVRSLNEKAEGDVMVRSWLRSFVVISGNVVRSILTNTRSLST